MGLQSEGPIGQLRTGEIVLVRLRPYFSTVSKTKKTVYWSTENDEAFDGRFTADHFIAQNLDQGSIYQNQILQYALRRLHTNAGNGILECNQFSMERFDHTRNGYSERRTLLKEKGLWTPERKIEAPTKRVITLAERLYPKDHVPGFPE
jgi:hypothetical protein